MQDYRLPAFMAKAGWDVTVLEKQCNTGGQGKTIKSRQDLRLIWDQAGIGCRMCLKDFLIVLEKKFRIIMNLKGWIHHTGFIGRMSQSDIPADYDALKKLFESIETGSGRKLDSFYAGSRL